MKIGMLITMLVMLAGWVGAAEITINPASTGAVDASAAIWGSPVAVPVGGNEYVYDLTGGADFLKIFEGNNAFPGDKLSLASGTLAKVKAFGDFGNLVMNGGTLSINASGSPTLTGSLHVDADSLLSNQLPGGNTATFNTALSGAGNLNLSAFLTSVSTVFSGSDAGFSGDFILGNSGGDGASQAVRFNQSYTNASLAFGGGNVLRAPVYQLINDISFLTVSMPSSADSSVLINLDPGTYDAVALTTAGINSAYFSDLGGSITVAPKPVISINPASTGAVDANAAIWGSPVAVPVGGNEYVYDLTGGADFLKIFEGNNAFPGDKLNLESGTLAKVKAFGDFGNLVMNGGTLSINASGSPSMTGSLRVDADSFLSNQLPGGNTATISAVLSGAGNLNVSTFLNSVNTVFSGSDAGFSGGFVLQNSGSDGASLAVRFNQSYTNASLAFGGGNVLRAPVYQLINDISFLTVSMPSSANSSVLINLDPGTYDAAALTTAGVHASYFNDLGGTIIVGVPAPSYATWAASWGAGIGAETDDPDGDLYANLYEYAMGGDPTNNGDWGEVPIFGNDAGTLTYTHAQRTDDASLIYYLETEDDLVLGSWTNSGYFVAGTNVTGGTFDYVTNTIPTVLEKTFIRLVIEK